MSLTEEQMIELMAYADGELEGEEAARVAAFAAANADAQRLLEDLGVLGTAVRAAEDERASVSSVDGIVDDVMRRLAVIEAPTAAIASIEGRRRSSGRGWALAAGGLALAAGVAFMLRGAPTLDESSGKPGAGGATVLASAGATDEDPSGVEIENVESADNAVSVFYLPAAAAGANLTASSVVVWITDPPPSGDL